MARKVSNIDKQKGLFRNRFTVEGKRYTVYGKTVTECKDKEFEKRQELAIGLYQSGKKLTVESYILRWLGSRERVVKSQTIRTYRKLINRLCNQEIDSVGGRFGDIKLINLETQNIRDMQTELLKVVSTRTANDTLSLLKKTLTAAVNERILSFNPAAAVDRVKRTEAPARDTIHRSLSREEVTAFLSAAKDGVEAKNRKDNADDNIAKDLAPSWYYNLYVFLLYSGLRIGEASALTLQDTVNGTINVHRTVIRSEIGYEIEEGTKTAAGVRTVPLYPNAKQALDQQKQINYMFEGVTNISNPIFHLPHGGIIRPDRVNDDIKKICAATGIEKFSCHAFRATFTSRCVQSGMQTKELMEILGHTDVKMTLGLYAHSEEVEKRRQLLAVNFD